MDIRSTVHSFFEQYWLSIPWQMILSEILSKLISLAILGILFIIGKKVLHKIFQKTVLSSIKLSSQSIARKQTLMRLLENCLDYLLYFVLIYWILVILGIPITSLLAGAGIAGVAIGLGAQGFLSDVVNGFFILLERQYDVGDTVIIGSVTGTVASVGVRTTQVRGFDGTLHFIPNRSISVVSNQSRGDMRALIEIPLYNDVDLTIVYDTVDQVNTKNAGQYTEIVKGPTIIGPQTLPNGQFVFRISIFTKNGKQHMIYNQFLKLYQEALIEAGVSLPTSNTALNITSR
ncbi:mechanosensitive ion channel family protein [uncultured Granulicatella sp.]|uniref:mechanosensitive ion channel family protein n=1 Tax=uncultured Granulicatella sp. TaxID=316089 RepID=UPI0037DDDACF